MCSLICVAKVVDKGMVPLVSVMTGLLWVSVFIIFYLSVLHNAEKLGSDGEA